MNGDKELYLGRSFDSILTAYYACYYLGRIFNALEIEEAAPCAPNFRDSLFHFTKLYSSDFREEYIGQYESVIEHSNRLYKDSLVRLTQISTFSLSQLMQNEKDKNTYMDLYDYKNKLKMIQLSLRFQALNINRPLEQDDCIKDNLKQFADLLKHLKSNNMLEDFKKYNSIYGKQ